MKKIILPIMVSIIIFLSHNAYADIATKAKVNVTAVRIRESASTDSNIITNIYEEDEVEVLEKNGEWYKVKSGNYVGYAKSEFFTITQEGDSTNLELESANIVSNETTAEPAVPATTPDISTPVVNSTSEETLDVIEPELNQSYTLSTTARLKIVPNLWAEEKLEIPQGTSIFVDGKLGNWYKITGQTSSGWITYQKLKEALTVASSPVEQTPEPAPDPGEEQSVQENPITSEETPQTSETPETPTETEPQAQTTSKTAVVTVETARVRSSASKSSEVIDTLDEDDIVTITGEEGDFYKISTSKISSGYISKTLVKVTNTTSRGSVERANVVNEEANANLNELLTNATSNSVIGENVIEFAKQYLGYPYVSGGSIPETGFDCSGFTRYVFAHFGYSLGRVAAEQTSLGATVERENLQTGDLLLFYDEANTKIGHCGIYIGNGEFIHSANPKRGVVTDNLNTNSYYNTRFITARRIIEK